jgi:regulatory protein
MDSSRPAEVFIAAIESLPGPYRRLRLVLDTDEAFVVPARVAGALGLAVGQRHSPASLADAVSRESAVFAMETAVAFLASRSRTEQEVRRRLLRGGYPEDVTEGVVSRLVELGYLNDADYAQRFVEDRLRSRPLGRRGLAGELRRHGVDAQTVDEATSAIAPGDERAAALELARHRLSRASEPDPRKRRQRLAALLQRRGFDWDTISSVLDEVLGED